MRLSLSLFHGMIMELSVAWTRPLSGANSRVHISHMQSLPSFPVLSFLEGNLPRPSDQEEVLGHCPLIILKLAICLLPPKEPAPC